MCVFSISTTIVRLQDRGEEVGLEEVYDAFPNTPESNVRGGEYLRGTPEPCILPEEMLPPNADIQTY